MDDNFPPLDVTTSRLAYAKGATSALGAAAVLGVMAFWLEPLSFDTFTDDQLLWGIAIFLLLLSLPEFAAAVLALLRPAVSIFRFDVDGVRIGGAGAVVPWRQIVSLDLHREDDKAFLQLAVRQPAPDLSWLLQRIYGLRTVRRGETVIYSIPRERLAQGDSELTHGLERIANRLVRK